MSTSGEIEIAKLWLPVIFTLVGWFFVNHQNKRIADRKEAREAADRCKQLCRSAASEAISYLNSSRKEAKKSLQRVKEHLDELEVEVNRLPLYQGKSPLVHRLAIFNRFIMSIDEAREELDEMEILELESKIRINRTNLLLEIEKQFKVHYC
ncbi:hypothetical protein M5C99_15375 [Acidovorax sp. NCPPB 2350]|nr:hypothetical protein M5C99_15375 [Acidovorax sp. NCPPB 2350]